MASSGSKTSTSKSKKGASGSPVIPTRRKLEVLGLVLMVLALLLSIAFVTYHPADDAIAESIVLSDALVNPAENQAQFRIRNGLGIVGAELARVMVPGFLGYTVLLLTGLLMAWGYAIFRHLNPRRLVYSTGLITVSAFVVASLIGWFSHALDTDLVTWAGAVGMGVAGWMQRIFGAVGSFILLVSAVAVMLLLVIDHDVQRSIDRVVDFVKTFQERLRTRWVDWKERRAARRAERKEQRQERRREREETLKERERRIEAEKQKQAEARQRAEAERARTEPPEDAPAGSAEPKASSTASSASSDPSRAEASTSRSAPPSSREAAPDDAAKPSATPSADGTSDAGSDATRDATRDADASSDASGGASGPGGPGVPPGDVPAGVKIRNDLFRDRAASDGAAGDDAPSPPSDDASGRPSEDDNLEELEAEFGEAFEAVSDEPLDDEPLDDEPLDDEPLDDRPRNESPADQPFNDTGDAEPVAEQDDPADASADEHDDIELRVQEQVEEEKADNIERTAEVPDEEEEIVYTPPSIDLLDASQESDRSVDHDELEENKRILLDKLETYNIDIQDIKAVVGPTVTRYELTPAPGIKVSRIKSLEDDLAMAMAAQGIRMIAPIPGKSAVGVEIPNRNRELVRLREVIGTAKFRDTDMELPFPLGKSIEGEVFLADLSKMPHLLIAGATGSGKSVGLNALLTGLIYACHPSNLKFVIIDPKKIELQQYAHLENHFIARPEDLDDAVITDVEEALGVLKSCEKEMEARYDLLSEASVRGIRSYNRKFKDGKLDPADGHRHMPYIVVVVDELADLMMTAGKEIEGPIARLAQMARAVGIHLVLATQRPSVDVITGLIKANFPSRIAYEVASRVDSRTILDQIGAEGLVGNGDLLYQSGSKLKRLQGPFVSVEEVERIVDFIADQKGRGPYTLPSLSDAGFGPDVTLGVEDTDDLFEEGARVIVRRQQGSVSLLQRKLAVGYTRAARIVDQLEEAGIVGPFNGTKARDVLVEDEEQLDRLLSGEDLEGDDDGDEDGEE